MKNTDAYPLGWLAKPPMFSPDVAGFDDQARVLTGGRSLVARAVTVSVTLLLLGAVSIRAAAWLADIAEEQVRPGSAAMHETAERASLSLLSSRGWLAGAGRAGTITVKSNAGEEPAYGLLGAELEESQSAGSDSSPETNTLVKPDPFAPMLDSYMNSAGLMTAGFERDILDSVKFTGFIDADDASEKVAILHINDPNTGEYTEVKRIGESFSLLDNKIVLKRINKGELKLTVDGTPRTLTLVPFEEVLPAQQAGSGSMAVPGGMGAGSGGGMAPAGMGAAGPGNMAPAGMGAAEEAAFNGEADLSGLEEM